MPTIKPPDGMLRAAGKATGMVDPEGLFIYLPLVAALEWWRDNPRWPSKKEIRDIALIYQGDPESPYFSLAQCVAVEWQRRMFSEPEIEAFIECPACRAKSGSPTLCPSCLHNRALIEKLSGRMTSGRSPLQGQGELKQESVPEEVKKLANWNEIDTTDWLSYDSLSVARALADKHNREVLRAYAIGREFTGE